MFYSSLHLQLFIAAIFEAHLFAHRGQKGAEKVHFGKNAFVLIFTAGILLSHGTIAYGLQIYVQPGDSLYKIAARYGTTVSNIMQANGLWSSAINPGQALRINPNSAGVSGTVSTSNSIYTVRNGDSLYLIGQKFGVTVDALKKANGLAGNYLTAGTRLVIPQGSTPSSSSATYRVKSGDTIYLIAKAYGISMESLRQANGLGSNPVLYPGQVLKIPAVSSSSGGSSKYYLSSSDIDLLARLVSAESDGEPFEGQVAVAATILNRLGDPRYPKTVSGIVYQIDNGCYQYSPVLDGRINNPASSNAYRAVNSALSGWDPSGGANGFYNPVKTDSSWVKSKPVTAVIGNHVFFSY
jgi:N-acetylmuramoyl-L-alanine amidase